MKAKFEIGDWVRCTQHGTEFQVKNITRPMTTNLYYDRENEYSYIEGCNVGHKGWMGIPEHLLEPVTDFRVGDIVECIESNSQFYTEGKSYEVERICNDNIPAIIDNYGCATPANVSKFKLISRGGKVMSKYDEMVKRIEKVESIEDGDNLLIELSKHYRSYQIIVHNCHGHDSGKYFIYKGSVYVDEWTQHHSNENIVFCEMFYGISRKLYVFKQALRWLLDHSDIKKDKQDKLDKIMDKISKLKEEAEEIRNSCIFLTGKRKKRRE